MNAASEPVHLDGPLLIFGGPYSNLEATQALLEEASRLRIPTEHTICTGDVVAYGADPSATVNLIRAAHCIVVMGNCEESLAGGTGDCGCGFPAGSMCDRLSAAWFARETAQLEVEALAWMSELPRRIVLKIAGGRIAVVNGGVERSNRFVFGSTAAIIKHAELRRAGLDGIISGHAGLPFTQAIGGRLWHNAGAIGMPANDGTPRVWYSVITPEKDAISIEHRALEYDYAAAAGKMRRAGLPEEYAIALETGLWPGCDVLPWKEIRERGIPLEPGKIVYQRPSSPQARKRQTQILQLWPSSERDAVPRLDPRKFRNPHVTADGAPRASVALRALKTLWF